MAQERFVRSIHRRAKCLNPHLLLLVGMKWNARVPWLGMPFTRTAKPGLSSEQAFLKLLHPTFWTSATHLSSARPLRPASLEEGSKAREPAPSVSSGSLPKLFEAATG